MNLQTNLSWIQKEIVLPGFSRGFHLITSRILTELPEIAEFQMGNLQVFIKHTSAALPSMKMQIQRYGKILKAI